MKPLAWLVTLVAACGGGGTSIIDSGPTIDGTTEIDGAAASIDAPVDAPIGAVIDAVPSCVGVDCSALSGPCSQGVCDPSIGACTAMPINEGNACDDGTPCTANDLCTAGSCAGTPRGAECDIYKATIGSFMDIAGVAGATQLTSLVGADDAVATYPLPFAFPYFGTSSSTIGVVSNGFINVGAGTATDFNNLEVPSTMAPPSAIFPFWDDLIPGTNGTVWVTNRGASPNQFVLIEWKDYELVNSVGSKLNFEVVLWEDGRIQFLYGMSTSGTTTGLNLGTSATVGIQDATGTHGAEAHTFLAADVLPGKIVDWTPIDATTYAMTPTSNLVSSWEEAEIATGLATIVSNCDDCSQGVALPFVFHYFNGTFGPGQPTTNVTIGSNGTVGFTTATPSFGNTPLPSTGAPLDLIACFWDDLDTTDTLAMGSNVITRVIGTAPYREFIIQFANVPTVVHPTNRVSFQVALYETTNRIECRYGQLLGVDDAVDGASATIGLNDGTGLVGYQVSFDTASVSQGSTLDFIPNSNTDTSAYTVVGPSAGLPDISHAPGVTIATDSTLGTADGYALVDLGFSFMFYGTTYTQVYLDRFGGVSFGTQGLGSSPIAFPLGSFMGPVARAVPEWSTLVGPASTVFYLTTGAPGSRTFTAQFQNEQYQIANGFFTTYAVRLFEADGTVELLLGPQQSQSYYATGEESSTGIGNVDGQSGVEICTSQVGCLFSGARFVFRPF
jgi:hypothetical protein